MARTTGLAVGPLADTIVYLEIAPVGKFAYPVYRDPDLILASLSLCSHVHMCCYTYVCRFTCV